MSDDKIDWSLTTWEGNQLRQDREFFALSFQEKMDRLESMAEVDVRLRQPMRVSERHPDPTD